LGATAAQSLFRAAQLMFLVSENTEIYDSKMIYYDNGDWHEVE
jgi:hypothetical protein